MAIRYIEQDRTFWLDTEHTSYIMAVVDEENFVGHVCCSDKKVSFLMSHKSLLIFLSRQFFQHQFFHFFQ